MDADQLADFVFEALAEPLGELGSAERDEHDTFLWMTNGVIYIQIDDQEFELDPRDSQNLENAMREALEAVEHVSHKEGDETVAEPKGDASVDETASMADYEVSQLQAELADLRDRSTRTLADFDNYRKRIERERREDKRYAAFESLRDFLGVIDNLERALASEGSAEDLKAGVELILRQMMDLLSSYGVARVEAEGKPFGCVSSSDPMSS